MPHTRLPTSHGPIPAAGPLAETPCEPTAAATTTRTAVAKASLKMLSTGLRTAALVQNTPSLSTGPGVSFQCGA